MNVLTAKQLTRRDHKLDCPPDKYDADNGDARRCPHGKWFVYKTTHRSGKKEGPGGYAESGKWSAPTPIQWLRLRRRLANVRTRPPGH